MVDNKLSYLLYDMVDGKQVDAADLCKEILSNPERGQSIPCNRPHTEKATSELTLSKNIYEVCKEGGANVNDLKMKTMGFDTKEKGMGQKAMYNFRMDPLLNEKFAYCLFPCSCTGCCT